MIGRTIGGRVHWKANARKVTHLSTSVVGPWNTICSTSVVSTSGSTLKFLGDLG